MYKIALTGGIGSGKSQVASLLAELGATVLDTDAIAHALTAPGGAAMAEIVRQFGAQAEAADGSLDRAWMRERAFEHPAERKRLEAILHPMIDCELARGAALASGLYLVFVVPLLVESARWRERVDSGSAVDRVCVVDCDKATQVQRVQARSGLTPAAIERIMCAQASRAQRLAAADDVIDNGAATSLADLRAAVLQLHAKWCRLAGAGGVQSVK